jgi:hypothetical protein
MCGLVFIIVRFPFFLIAVVIISLFWLTCFSITFVVGSALSVIVLVICAFANDPDAMHQWFRGFMKRLGAIIVHLIESNNVCWKFLIGEPSGEIDS